MWENALVVLALGFPAEFKYEDDAIPAPFVFDATYWLKLSRSEDDFHITILSTY